MKKGMFAAAAAMLFCVSPAYAGYVTENLAGLNAIYAQAGLYIKFDPILTIVQPELVSIDTQIEFNKLTGLGYRTPNGSTLKKVSAFFVDEIGWCGVTSPSVIGCSQIGGPNLVVESSATAADALKYGPFGPTNVFAHELGHTLGLSHVAEWDSGNLMAPYEQGTSLGYLNESQISSILSNVAKTIQIDSDNNKFIEIQPYAVVASAAAVPEPATWTMLALGFGAIGFNIRKKKSNRSSLEVLS